MPRPATRPLIDAMLMMRPPWPRSIIALPSQLRAEHAAGEIQVDQLAPFFERHRFRGDVLAPAADVVDENVDRPVTLQSRLARLLRIRPGLPTSAAMVQACRPRARMSPAVFSRLGRSRPTRTTSAPASAIASAISRPRPRLPPVMKRRFPVNLNRSKMLMLPRGPLANFRGRASLLTFRRGCQMARMSPCFVEHQTEANPMTKNDDAEKVARFEAALESVDRADRGGSLRARHRPGGKLVDRKRSGIASRSACGSSRRTASAGGCRATAMTNASSASWSKTASTFTPR